METELLRSFGAVARTQSFTAAARELGYVQSTVTGHVHALERHLGRRLFDRLPAGSVPTDAGRRLLAVAQELLALEARLQDAANDEPQGVVRVAAPESLCAYRLPALIRELRGRAPGIRLAPVPAGTTGALESVRSGTAELALLLEPAQRVPDLATQHLGTEPVVIVAAASAATAPHHSWAGLAEQDALLLEEGCSYSDDAVRRLVALGQPATRRTHFGSIEAIKQCVLAGLGWTVLPRVAVERDLAERTLVTIDGPAVRTPNAYLVGHPKRALGAAARQVQELLIAGWPPG